MATPRIPRCPGQDTRYWTADAVFDVRCGNCGRELEFFKDEPARTCPSCRNKVANPRLDLGCAKWCAYGEQCLQELSVAHDQPGSLCDRIIEQMKVVFGEDQRRIDHALEVLRYAEQIMESEKDIAGVVVRAAAILHDIGTHEAERKHGSSAAKYQETEGPPIARRILEDLKLEPPIIDHVCRIVANHHSGVGIDTSEFRVIWDADKLVNLTEQDDDADAGEAQRVLRTFKTKQGKQLAETLLRERSRS